MKNNKHRIIGAIVLLALAVIFLPMLFQHSPGPKIRVSDIPAAPAVLEVTKPDNLPAPVLAAPETQKNSPAAWTLQLGSFANKTAATDLVKRLRARGYPTYTQEFKMNNTIVTRVYVGPEFDQQKLKNNAAKIEELLKLKGTVIQFKSIIGAEHD
jgi:DedD protein